MFDLPEYNGVLAMLARTTTPFDMSVRLLESEQTS